MQNKQHIGALRGDRSFRRRHSANQFSAPAQHAPLLSASPIPSRKAAAGPAASLIQPCSQPAASLIRPCSSADRVRHRRRRPAEHKAGPVIAVGRRSVPLRMLRVGWCCWRGLNSRPLPSSHHGFRRPPPRAPVRGLDHPFAPRRQSPAVGRRPSGLYAFPHGGLGSGSPSSGPTEGFPDFGRCSAPRSREARQIYQGSALPLSYSSIRPAV